MNRSKTSSRFSWDLAFSGIFLLLGAFGFYTFFYGQGSWTQITSNGTFLGELEPSRPSGVRFRANSSMIWQDVGNTHPVSVGDAVFTGSSASSNVIFKNQIETEIAPDSLVIFNEPSKEIKAKFPRSVAVLSMQRGSVKLKVLAEGDPYLIESNGKIFSMSTKALGTYELHVNSENGKFEATSDQGSSFALTEETEVPKIATTIPTDAERSVASEDENAPLEETPIVAQKIEQPSSQPTVAPLAKIEIPTGLNKEPIVLPHLDSDLFKLSVGYGFAVGVINQTGAFGTVSGDSISTAALKAGLDFQSDEWGACMKFSRYSLDFEVDSVGQVKNKNFQNIELSGSYRNFHVGVHAMTAPFVVVVSSTDLRFIDLTTIALGAGYQFKKDWLSVSGKKLSSSLDFTAELPFSGSSSILGGAADIKSISGFAARLTGGLEKTLTRARAKTDLEFAIGIEASAGFTQTQLNASFLNLNGESARKLQEYEAILQLRMSF
jgi:hypothetical protein